MAAQKNMKTWKSRFCRSTKRFSSKSNQKEHKTEAPTKHSFQDRKSCQMDLTAGQITDSSRSKEGKDVHSVERSAPHIADKCVLHTRRASEPQRQVLASNEFRAPRHNRSGSLQFDRTSCHNRFDIFEAIRNLDLPTRRLLQIDIIEPLDFDKLKYEMLFGRGLR